ncbi:MAG: leucine-rich repeat domain-containing protein [Candidatus Choladocola sp.]|nr:leucine-rich repeat domain-containing protein [Candidatus Choladocola sp.]
MECLLKSMAAVKLQSKRRKHYEKRFLSLAMALCMVLSLLPAAAFADENAETPVCTCEEACTAEEMDAEYPVCGAEGAAVEDCCKYAEAIKEESAEAATQSETEESEEGGSESTGSETADSETVESEEADPEATGSEAAVCNCENSCTAEGMNTECPVCGAEGAAVENCGKYIAPVVEEQVEEVVQVGAPAGEEPELTAVEKVQAMINALPTVEEMEDAGDEKVDEVYAAVQDVCDALDELSTEELDQITGLDKLADLLEWFTGPVSTFTEPTDADYFVFDNGTIKGLTIKGNELTEIVIPDTIDGVKVTSIGDRAFEYCTGLTSITIPNSVISIGNRAFFERTGLTSITIPNSVTSIGNQAFYGCTGLTSITIPNSVTSIGNQVFYGCTDLTSITIPNGVTSIGNQVFYGCTSLTSITIPNSVTSIGNQAFYECTSLTSIEIPSNVTSIEFFAFGACSGLASIFLPDKEDNLTIGMGAIPDETSKVRYSLDTSKGEVTITEISLGDGRASVDIPATICGYPVVAVEASQQSKVGGHTCKGGTATCATKAVCSLCGKEYGELADHTYEWKSENGEYWKKCQYCGDETAKKDIPAITINGADKVCVTQEYKFSFTLPEGTADPVYGYDFTTKGDMGLEAVIENGEPYGVVPAEWYDLNQSSFEVYAGATTDDGFEFFVSKTVALQVEHTDTDPKDHICDVCGITLSRHTGGAATCSDKAVCEYCGKEYGEIDSTNHNLEKVPAKAATVTETGNTEYWQCQDCGDLFSDPDGKDKIELEDTVTEKLPPEIIEGKGQSVTAGEKKELTFKSNAAFSDFIRVELDGKTLDEKNYTAEEGSTVVTLDADYVSTLSAGEHTIGIVSESGTASTTFTVNAKADSTDSPQAGTNNTNTPQTGDNSPLALWIALLLASGCLLTIMGIYGKKKKYNR